MPKSKQECERIREKSKKKIINAAIEVFAKKGYAATGTNDIAEAANISVGLLYRYFSSKQELFESIANFAMEGLIKITQALNNSGNPKEIIDALCGIMLKEMENPEFINLSMMMIQGVVSEDNPVFKTILWQDEKMFEAAASLIQKGQSEGIFSSGDPTAKSMMLFSSIQGMSMMKFLFKDNFKLPSLAEMTAFLY